MIEGEVDAGGLDISSNTTMFGLLARRSPGNALRTFPVQARVATTGIYGTYRQEYTRLGISVVRSADSSGNKVDPAALHAAKVIAQLHEIARQSDCAINTDRSFLPAESNAGFAPSRLGRNGSRPDVVESTPC